VCFIDYSSRLKSDQAEKPASVRRRGDDLRCSRHSRGHDSPARSARARYSPSAQHPRAKSTAPMILQAYHSSGRPLVSEWDGATSASRSEADLEMRAMFAILPLASEQRTFEIRRLRQPADSIEDNWHSLADGWRTPLAKNSISKHSCGCAVADFPLLPLENRLKRPRCGTRKNRRDVRAASEDSNRLGSVQSSSLLTVRLHRRDFYVAPRKLTPKLQDFSKSIQETSMMRFYSSIYADNKMLIRQISCDDVLWAQHGPRGRLPIRARMR
jgi:hypothetical protein